ncbi:MAG: hypothetical protein JOY51_05370 [Nevskia sp.]|nr:hypothetical protein [Nevskia sp.]
MMGPMKSTRELLGYGFAALVLGGGTAYGWHLLVRPPPIPPVPPLTEPAALPTPVASVPAPEPVQAAAVAPVSRPARQAAPAPDPVATPATTYAQDQAQFYELQNGCYTAAANNSNGQYPAFQAMACDRYARFAAEHGWDPGTLPAYGQPAAAAPQESTAQRALPQDQARVLYVVPGVDYGQGHRHRQARQDADGAQQQIGPNYPLPPPQQPPPVSQRQQPASKVVRARGTQK